MKLPTNVKWLRNFGTCQYCAAKPATVAMMSAGNDEIGRACAKCALKALAASRTDHPRGTCR